MTLDEIDKIFDIMVAEAAEKGDESLLPGSISLSADNWAAIARPSTGMTCTNILHGIRYRGIRVNVSRAYEGQVLNRADAGDVGKPYFDLEPKV